MPDFLIMAAATAAKYRSETAGDMAALDPRLIEVGPYAGKYALPISVDFDPAFSVYTNNFDSLTRVTLDPAAAWPEQPA